MLVAENGDFWRDHKSAKINAIRTRTLLAGCDLPVIRFGAKYRVWNAAFDAGYCAARGRPYITLHRNIVHALKEIDAATITWASTAVQVVAILDHVMRTK